MQQIILLTIVVEMFYNVIKWFHEASVYRMVIVGEQYILQHRI